jgi:diaminopimelate epimerase
MTGSGNDFVMVDGRNTTPRDWSEADMRAVCARGTGVGADGLVFVSPGSRPNAVQMVYFNADGSRAAMCGNAALCSTRLAGRLAMAKPQAMILETDAGVYESRCVDPGERAQLKLAAVPAPAAVPGLGLLNGERAVLGTVGVPHLVILADDVSCIDVVNRGRALRFDPALGPAGANINFISPSGARTEWRMRTYERGVEAETLACGTGAVAAACAITQWGLGESPITIWTRSGRPLEVSAHRNPEGGYDEIWLTGEARLVFRGVIN